MSEIKAIQTEYNGYRFRSRLEARWAVFFDAANIEYQYEPEGFDLGNGLYYLPDFYLPGFDLYVEIKPFDKKVVHHVGDGNVWEQTCERFRDITDRAILICYGDPATDLDKHLFTFDTCDSSAGSSDFHANFIMLGDDIVLCTEETRADRDIYTRGFSDLTQNENVGTPAMLKRHIRFYKTPWDEDEIVPYRESDFVIEQTYDPKRRDLLNSAKTKARQARFEHGEKPFSK